MTVGAVLVLYAAALGVLGPLACRPGGWLERTPKLGATVLLAAGWSVLAALFLAGLTIAMPCTALSNGVSQLLGACVLRLRAAYATPGGAAVAGAGLTLSAVVALRALSAAVEFARLRRAERRRQRSLIALCGRAGTHAATVVLDQPQAAAYCLAGRRGQVVVTTGVLDLLSEAELAAVLAHERAHIEARHHRMQGAAALAARALPELPLLRGLTHEVRRLLEMHADEIAARAHDPETLARALVTMASAQPRTPSLGTSSAALAAADSDIVARIERLLLHDACVTAVRRRGLRATAAAFALIPLLVAGAPAAVAAGQPPVRGASHSVAPTANVGH